MGERFVVLGLAGARVGWFRTLAQWASTGVVPIEFIRCVGVQELRVRLTSGRRFSAVVVDAALPSLDRDLIEAAREHGVPTLVVDDTGGRDWRALGGAAVLQPPFAPDELVEVLQAASQPVAVAAATLAAPAADAPASTGTMVVVTGSGGTGASSVAIALAQGQAARSQRSDERSPVVLADLCRDADQAMLHDARTLVPSIQELIESHRTNAQQPPAVVLSQTFEVPARGYRVLLGLRRPSHWVTLRRRAVEAALDSLLGAARWVVADVEADLEGEADTGSSDVEDRNMLARAATVRASAVVVVAEPSMKGVFAAVRVVDRFVAAGTPPERILPVMNRSPRSPRARAAVTSAFAELASGASEIHGELANPLYLPVRDVDTCLRDGVALPDRMARSLTLAVDGILARAGSVPGGFVDDRPVVVAPGSLATFTAQDRPTS